MGRRGPPPTPRKIKLLKGTFRKDRAPAHIPEPPKGARPPARLSKGAKQEWRRLAPWLEDQGLLTKADEAAFSQYCELYVDVQKHWRLCRRHGPGVAIREGFRNALAKGLKDLKQYLSLFGLSPADRERIGAQPASTPRDQ